MVGPGAAVESGFGDRDNTSLLDLQVFGDHLYVGTQNFFSAFKVFRTLDGIDYEQVGLSGFGDPGNAYAWRLHTYEDAIWLGTFNIISYWFSVKGASVWRSFDGVSWQEQVGGNGVFLDYGFDNIYNWGVRTFETYNGKLYIGTANCFLPRCEPDAQGLEIWEWPGEACPANP